jgi:hypothetical protein
MTTDNRTDHLHLPLPHQDNLLEEDVRRLREALSGLDVHAGQTDATLATKADATAVTVALGVKADSATMQSALAAKSDKSETDSAIAEHLAQAASITTVGHIQLATDAEAADGEITGKAVNPKQMKQLADPARNDRANSYKSSGSGATSTGFKLLDDTDLGALFGKIDSVTLETSGSGNYVGSIAVGVTGKAAKITQNKVGPTYCSHCGYCSYCSYCTHCAYPGTNNTYQSSYNTTTATYSLEGGGSATITLRRTNCNCQCNCSG